MEKFTVNGKVYFAKDLDFLYLVELDKRGIALGNITGLAAVNVFFAFCSGLDEDKAAYEISQHIIKGGKLDDIVEVYGKMIEESDFFRTLLGASESEQEKPEQTTKKTPKKKAEVTE